MTPTSRRLFAAVHESGVERGEVFVRRLESEPHEHSGEECEYGPESEHRGRLGVDCTEAHEERIRPLTASPR